LTEELDPQTAEHEDVEDAADHSAPQDDVLADGLAAPTDAAQIYLEEASPYRPIATGDIFRGAPLPSAPAGDVAHDLTMLVAHPSAMRKGAALEPMARAATVAPINNLSKRKWPPGHFNVFPLPLLSDVAKANGFEVPARGWGALLELAAPVETEALNVETRVACLSPEGITLLLQRLVHADTRVAVKPCLITKLFAPKLEEIELLESWNIDLVPVAVAGGVPLRAALANAASDFDIEMNTGSPSPRQLLEGRTNAAEARRHIAREIRRRMGLIA
jgi:hypothetical protein